MSASRVESAGPRDSMTSANSTKMSPQASPRRGGVGTPKYVLSGIGRAKDMAV